MNLEYLCVEPLRSCDVDLSSQSVKILKLSSEFRYPKICLSFPSLEFLDLSINMSMELKRFHGEMPILRTAVINILSLHEDLVPVLCDILRSVTNVLELTLHIWPPYPKHIPGATRGQKQVSCFYTSLICSLYNKLDAYARI